jgi:hypothetical protein
LGPMPAAMVMAHGVAAAVDVTLLGRYQALCG